MTLFRCSNTVILSTFTYKNIIITKLFLESTPNQRCSNVKFRCWFNIDKLTLFDVEIRLSFQRCYKDFIFSRIMIWEQMLLKSTQNQRCFNVEFYRWINVDKSTLNQRGYHVDQRRDVISTYINVESTLSVCWEGYPSEGNQQSVNSFFTIKQLRMNQNMM